MTIAKICSRFFQFPEVLFDAGSPVLKMNFNKVNEMETHSITPYVPPIEETEKLTKAFENGMEGIIYLIKDPLVETFTIFSPKDLANFSGVNKSCYLVTKCESIWLYQLNELLRDVKPIPKECCSYNIEWQFKIIFNRVQRETKPFKDQYDRNNAELCFLRGPTGFDGEVDRAWKRYQKAISENDGTEERARLEYVCRDDCRAWLGGYYYDGTPQTLFHHSIQGELRYIIERMMPDQLDFEEVIRTSKKEKEKLGKTSTNSIEILWREGVQSQLIHSLCELGIVTFEKFYEKFQQAPEILSKVGIESLADLQALGILKTSSLNEVQVQEETLSEDVPARHAQIRARKEQLCSLLDTVSKTLSGEIKNEIKESEIHGFTDYSDLSLNKESTAWLAFQQQLDKASHAIEEKCQSPHHLAKSFAQIVDEINGLIREFNSFDRESQLTRLHTYLHRPRIQETWEAIKASRSDLTLSKYAKEFPDRNLFQISLYPTSGVGVIKFNSSGAFVPDEVEKEKLVLLNN